MATIAEIRARWAQATAGPWGICLGSGHHMMTGISAEITEERSVAVCDCLPQWALDGNCAPDDHRPTMEAIAAAPTDIATLLAALDAANAQIARDAPVLAAVDEWYEAEREAFSVNHQPYGEVAALIGLVAARKRRACAALERVMAARRAATTPTP